jgi:TolB-like protein/Tfp pilus assembly protein PilF
MPQSSNKISNFWQELKRRKVVRVITVYAAAAFVILELVDIVSPSLGLPEWTMNFIIVLICVGFIITVIVSWIYDIHPEGGIVKTEPTHKVKEEGKAVSSSSWKITSYISFVVIVGLIVLNIIPHSGKKEILEKSIAVLPFDDMSPQKDQEYFCDGMTEEIINALTHVEGLKVIARTSAFAFKGKHEDIREIGKKLDVETLLEGSIRKDADRLRITVQLIKVSDGSHLWSDTYDRDLESIFDIQDEISLAIVDNLKVQLLGEKKTAIVKRPTENLEAYNLYLKGTYYLEMLTPEGLQKALEHFEQALQKDPNFALAYVGMAKGYYHLSFGAVSSIEAFPRAIEYATKALEIDNTIAETYTILGDINIYFYWNWEAAERYYKQALQLTPNLANIHSGYSVLLTLTKRNKEAIAEAIRAQELDPLSSWSNFSIANAYYFDHQYDRAIEVLQMTLAKDPNLILAHSILGGIYRSKLMSKEAIAEYEKAVELSSEAHVFIGDLAMIYYEFGEKAKADRLFDRLKQISRDEYVPPSSFYLIHKARGEEDLAYEWFERAVNQRDSWLLWLIIDPIEQGRIPDEPRYNTLLKKVGLEKYQH